ncbi:MAG: GNAT family N-acetyltransferase [Ignavibacteriaceae bacterium]|jgi:predicted GNAT family N-acyltransferase|nr:GNAT family N-acetyltransferase [Ignavibacteriaceae bacterium]
MKIEIKHIAFGGAEHKKEIDLRYKVLRQPLGLNYTQEQLDAEKDEFHFAAFDGEKLAGCLLMKAIDKEEIKMRQVAVDEDYQGKGVGKGLVLYSEKYATENGFSVITLHARKTAVPFYEKLGYKIVGDEFTEVTIPHFKMNKEKPLFSDE